MSGTNLLDRTVKGEVLKIQADEIFKAGAVISIKKPSNLEFMLSVIQKIEGQNIYFRLPEEFLVKNVLKGAQLWCHIMDNDNEYVVYGLISEIGIKYPWVVEVVAEKITRYKNNRRTKRYLVNFPSRIFSAEMEDGIYAIIKNISITGFSAVFKQELDSFGKVTASIPVDKFTSLQFKAKPVRTVDKIIYFEYGFEITEIDSINKDLLERLIYKLECDETEFIADNLR